MSSPCQTEPLCRRCTEEANDEDCEKQAACCSYYGTIAGPLLTQEQFYSVYPPQSLSILTAKCQSYYTLSVILGTVALSYGSVPMYKMVNSVWSFST